MGVVSRRSEGSGRRSVQVVQTVEQVGAYSLPGFRLRWDFRVRG